MARPGLGADGGCVAPAHDGLALGAKEGLGVVPLPALVAAAPGLRRGEVLASLALPPLAEAAVHEHGHVGVGGLQGGVVEILAATGDDEQGVR